MDDCTDRAGVGWRELCPIPGGPVHRASPDLSDTPALAHDECFRAVMLGRDLLGRVTPHFSPGTTLSALIGILAGIGLENKYSIVFPLAGLLFGILLTPERKWLRSPYLAISVGVAVLLFVPNLLWLIHHGFPFLEFERNSRQSDSRILRGPVSFLVDQARLTSEHDSSGAGIAVDGKSVYSCGQQSECSATQEDKVPNHVNLRRSQRSR